MPEVSVSGGQERRGGCPEPVRDTSEDLVPEPQVSGRSASSALVIAPGETLDDVRVPVLQDQVEAAEPTAAGTAETADQRGQGASPPAGRTRGGAGMLPPDLSGALSCHLQLPDHSGRHIPQCHVRARLPTVVAQFNYSFRVLKSFPLF